VRRYTRERKRDMKLRSLAAAVDGMVVTDQNGTILRSNAATTKLFQRGPEVVGQNAGSDAD
jgi:PAS domain-containing protein